MTRVLIRVLGCAALVLGLVAPAPALQTAAETKEIEAYRLTPGALQKVIAVNRAVVQALMADPSMRQALKLRQEIEALQGKDELTEADEKRLEELEGRLEQLDDQMMNPLGGEARSLGEMEARIRTYPPLVQALEREGMSPREYATFWLVFVQAAFAHGFQKAGMLKELPAGVSPENVRFIGEHEAEIQAMQKEFEALGAGQLP